MADTIIRVEFIDAATGQIFGFTNSPVEMLPETFALNTSINLGGQEYGVVKAEPVTRAEYVAQGKLVLTLTKITMMPVKDILYTLPTICDPIPATDKDASGAGKNVFTIHADFWRHIEFVAPVYQAEVQTELNAIADIFEQHREAQGFNKLHIRKTPATPVVGLFSVGDLVKIFSGARLFDTIQYDREPGLLKNVYAMQYGKWVLYGEHRDGQIQSLAIDPQREGPDAPTTPFVQLMQARNLAVVDWCNMGLVMPEGIDAYLKQFDGQ